MRRPLAFAALALVLATTATPAAAHSPARVRIAAPEEGANVSGRTVRVILVGEGGDAAATFRLDLDGQTVDATGTVGGVFSTLSVAPGAQLVLEVPVAAGEHILTVTPSFDPDAMGQQEPEVRRFVAGADSGSATTAVALAGVAIAGAVGAAVAVRRKAAAQGTGDTT